MKSFFIGKYKIKLPIIQGGMDVGVLLSDLVSTVANEGGGSSIGVNTMVALPNYVYMVCTFIAEKVDIIFSSIGMWLDLPLYLTKESRIQLVPIVFSARVAKEVVGQFKEEYNICE